MNDNDKTGHTYSNHDGNIIKGNENTRLPMINKPVNITNNGRLYGYNHGGIVFDDSSFNEHKKVEFINEKDDKDIVLTLVGIIPPQVNMYNTPHYLGYDSYAKSSWEKQLLNDIERKSERLINNQVDNIISEYGTDFLINETFLKKELMSDYLDKTISNISNNENDKGYISKLAYISKDETSLYLFAPFKQFLSTLAIFELNYDSDASLLVQIDIEAPILQILIQHPINEDGVLLNHMILVYVRCQTSVKIFEITDLKQSWNIHLVYTINIELAHISVNEWIIGEFVGITYSGIIFLWNLSDGKVPFEIRKHYVKRKLYNADLSRMCNDCCVFYAHTPRHFIALIDQNAYLLDCSLSSIETTKVCINQSICKKYDLLSRNISLNTNILAVSPCDEFPFLFACSTRTTLLLFDIRLLNEPILVWELPNYVSVDESSNMIIKHQLHMTTCFEDNAIVLVYSCQKQNAMSYMHKNCGILLYRFKLNNKNGERGLRSFISVGVPHFISAFKPTHDHFYPCRQFRCGDDVLYLNGILMIEINHTSSFCIQMDASGEIRGGWLLDKSKSIISDTNIVKPTVCNAHCVPTWWNSNTIKKSPCIEYSFSSIFKAIRCRDTVETGKVDKKSLKNVIDVLESEADIIYSYITLPKSLWQVSHYIALRVKELEPLSNVTTNHFMVSNRMFMIAQALLTCLNKSHDSTLQLKYYFYINDHMGYSICKMHNKKKQTKFRYKICSDVGCSQWWSLHLYSKRDRIITWPKKPSTNFTVSQSLDLSMDINLLLAASQGEDISKHVQTSKNEQKSDTVVSTTLQYLIDEWKNKKKA